MHGPAGRVKFSCVTYLLILTYLRYFRSDLIIYFHQNYDIKVLFCLGFFLLKFMNHRAVREDRANSKFSQVITADSPPLQIVGDRRNPTKTLWFPSARYSPLSFVSNSFLVISTSNESFWFPFFKYQYGNSVHFKR